MAEQNSINNTASELTVATGFNVSSGGILTSSTQPAFFAYVGTQDTNATGDGTVFDVGSGNALTILLNQGTNFVDTGTFTAPVTGWYQFSGVIAYNDMTTSVTETTIRFVVSGTSAGNYLIDYHARS